MEVHFKKQDEYYYCDGSYCYSWMVRLFIHNKNDFADAMYLHNQFNHVVSSQFVTGAKLKNRHVTKVSTKAKPCRKYWPKSCHDLFVQRKIDKEFGCQVPYFKTVNPMGQNRWVLSTPFPLMYQFYTKVNLLCKRFCTRILF